MRNYLAVVFFLLSTVSFADDIKDVSGEDARVLSSILSNMGAVSRPDMRIGPSSSHVGVQEVNCKFFKRGIAAGVIKWGCEFTDSANRQQKNVVNAAANDLAEFLEKKAGLSPSENEIEKTYKLKKIYCSHYFNVSHRFNAPGPFIRCSVETEVQSQQPPTREKDVSCNNPKAKQYAEMALKNSYLSSVAGIRGLFTADCDPYNLENQLGISHAMNMSAARCGIRLEFQTRGEMLSFVSAAYSFGGSIRMSLVDGGVWEVPVCVDQYR